MRTDGLSNSYRTRNVFGRHFLQHLYRFMASSMAGHRSGADCALAAARDHVASAADAAVECRLAVESCSAPLVQAGEVSPWAKLEPNYITASPRRVAHRAAESRAARPARHRQRREPAADAAAPCVASRDRVRRRAATGERDRRRSRGAAARRRARRSRHRRAADDALEAAARENADGHRRQDDSRVSREPDHVHDARPDRTRRVPREPHASQGSRQRSARSI